MKPNQLKGNDCKKYVVYGAGRCSFDANDGLFRWQTSVTVVDLPQSVTHTFRTATRKYFRTTSALLNFDASHRKTNTSSSALSVERKPLS